MTANKIQAWNAVLCPPLGFGLNFLLLWLILRRTPKEMMVHSRVLLQTCLTDCLLLVLQTVGQQICIFEPGSQNIVFFDGYLIRLFRPAFEKPLSLLILNMLWLLFTHVSGFGISVQFLYRYLVLTRNKNVTLCQYLLMLAVPILCTDIIVLVAHYDVYPTVIVYPLSAGNTDTDKVHYTSIIFHYSSIIDFDQQPLFVSAKFNDLTVISLALFAFMYACAYTVILFCGWKMIRFLDQHATFNARLKELNKQLTRNLILLASFPLLMQFIVVFILINMYYEVSVETCFYAFIIFHWLPVLNPLSSILTNRPYREAVTRRLRLCSSSSSTTTVVAPIAANE